MSSVLPESTMWNLILFMSVEDAKLEASELTVSILKPQDGYVTGQNSAWSIYSKRTE